MFTTFLFISFHDNLLADNFLQHTFTAIVGLAKSESQEEHKRIMIIVST